MSVEVDALTSADGTAVTVTKVRNEGTAKTIDEAVLEALTGIDQKLGKILTVLEFEFEMQGDTLDGED